MQKFISLFLVLLISLSSIPAYSCAVAKPPQEEFKKSDLVFTGTLEKAQCKLIKNTKNAKLTKTYKVKSIWKGAIERHITTKEIVPAFTCNEAQCKKFYRDDKYNTCDYMLPGRNIGSRYIIFGRHTDNSEYVTVDESSACGHSRRLSFGETFPQLGVPLKTF